MSDPVRVLIVDDDPATRRAVNRALAPDPRLVVVGIVPRGADAARLLSRLCPEVVVVRATVPELSALPPAMRLLPVGVLLLGPPGPEVHQLQLAAAELELAPLPDAASDPGTLAPVLRDRVLALADRARSKGSPPVRYREDRRYEVVLIGASTGGPRALLTVLTALPAGFAAGLVLAQHMPAKFTRTLAERLDRQSELRVREARDGDEIGPGLALVAPGGAQTRLERGPGGLVVRVDPGSADDLHQPSVDLLLRSAADVVGPGAVGVVLTGMGMDGARGLRALREAGGRTLVESESTAIIFGMPRAAASAAEAVLPLSEVGPALVELCGQGPRHPGDTHGAAV